MDILQFLEDLLIPIIAIVAVFGLPLGIVAIVYAYKNKSEATLHQTLQEAIKTGHELTPELIASMPGSQDADKPNHEHNDIRNGIILIGTGTGLMFLGYFGLGKAVVAGAGMLVMGVGLAYTIFGIYSHKKKNLQKT